MQNSPFQVVEFQKELLTPRATKAYGIDTRELRHNAFFDFMLKQPEFGPALLRAVASKISQCGISTDQQSTSGWADLAKARIVGICCVSNSSQGTRRRPDEIVRCEVDPDKKIVVVVEMKVNAPDDEKQLGEYVTEEVKKCPDSGVSGLRLSIRGVDDDAQPATPLLNGEVYRECIAEALSHSALNLPEKTRWLISDYCDTLRFLALCDKVITACGEWLRYEWLGKYAHRDELIGGWLTDNLAWVQQRVARDIARKSKKQGGVAFRMQTPTVRTSILTSAERSKCSPAATRRLCTSSGKSAKASHFAQSPVTTRIRHQAR
jgi:hypothetical protein